jgi:hypothetical protein
MRIKSFLAASGAAALAFASTGVDAAFNFQTREVLPTLAGCPTGQPGTQVNHKARNLV